VSIDLAGLAGRYLAALEDADRRGAVAVAEQALDEGADPTRVLLEIVVPAQTEVGVRWQANRWSVAQEHAATAISEAAVAAVAARTDVEPTRGHVVVACIDQEWHALPARIVAEVLALAGWRTTYLGAATPPAHLAGFLAEVVPDVLALSCSLSTGLPRAHRMIRAGRDIGVPVLVGGRGFRGDPALARRLGADGWAASAREAVVVVDGLAVTPTEPFEHPGLDEQADLQVRRLRLVDAAVDRLRRRFPPLRAYSREQHARTREDFGHIVDFLGAAVCVDEPAIFLDFTDWLQDVLVSRGVHEEALAMSYEALAEVLGDLPRARAVLAEATGRLPLG
jgi:methanogenic corrinoid protein MtbC1